MTRRSNYSGAVAFITGGASGIGKALAEELAARGAEVVVADRQAAEGKAVADAIRRDGGKAHALTLDVRDGEAFESAAREAVKRAGRIDYFFNNAGIGVSGDVAKYARRDWEDVFDVNLRGVTNGIQAIYPIMIAQGSGHIINTASMAGLMPMAGGASYAATKHAVVGISKALRIEAAPLGIRVSALCPGAIRTPILTGGKYGRNELSGVDAATLLALWERVRPMDPRDFAEQVLDAVARNEPYIIVPKWWRAFWLLERISPSLGLYLAERMYAQRNAMLAAAPQPARPRESSAPAATPRTRRKASAA